MKSKYIGSDICPFKLSEEMLVNIKLSRAKNADITVLFHDGNELLTLSKQAFGNNVFTNFDFPSQGKTAIFQNNGEKWLVVNTETPKNSRNGEYLAKNNLHPRRIGATIAKVAEKYKHVSIPADELYDGAHGLASTLYELAYGIQVAGYNTSYLSSSPSIKRNMKVSIRLFTTHKKEYKDTLLEAEDSARAIHFQRVIGDTPSNLFNTAQAVETSLQLKKYGLDVKVHYEKGLETMKAGGILSVGRGAASRNPPAIAVISRIVDQKQPISAYVGKGLVYDTGGVQDKGTSMNNMHLDMLGMADVLSTAFRLGLHLKRHGESSIRHNFLGIVGIAENTDGPDAYHPSDIITMKNGKKVNVYHTDAEGRLVLADCIDLAQDYIAKQDKTGKGSTIVESSTLTGAIVSGLGSKHAAIYADSGLDEGLLLAARLGGEAVHQMPFSDEEAGYLDAGLETKHGDFLSGGGSCGGSLVAARFLNKFVRLPQVQFAHIDRAGPMTGGVDAAGHPASGYGAHGTVAGLLWHHFRTRGWETK